MLVPGLENKNVIIRSDFCFDLQRDWIFLDTFVLGVAKRIADKKSKRVSLGLLKERCLLETVDLTEVEVMQSIRRLIDIDALMLIEDSGLVHPVLKIEYQHNSPDQQQQPQQESKKGRRLAQYNYELRKKRMMRRLGMVEEEEDYVK